jgi:hypothetical protein
MLTKGYVFLSKLKSKDVYSYYIDNIKTEPVSQYSLKRIFNLTEADCNVLYLMPYKVTLDAKLRWLQYRITHNILPTNVWLCKIGILDNDLCTFCMKEKETAIHVFANCEVVNSFWQTVTTHFSIIPDLNVFNKIYGILDTNTNNYAGINQIMLIAKRYIYKCRCDQSKFSFIALKNMIKDTIKLEYFCAQRASKLEFHFQKWDPFLNLI